MTDKNAVWLDLPLLGGYQRVTKESNPVSWNYFVGGSDMGGNLDMARAEAWEQEWSDRARVERQRRYRDWHYDVPRTHWRQKNGRSIAIARMSDDHLGHCIRFAKTKRQHQSRYWPLIAEQNRREEAHQSTEQRLRRTTLPRGRGDYEEV